MERTWIDPRDRKEWHVSFTRTGGGFGGVPPDYEGPSGPSEPSVTTRETLDVGLQVLEAPEGGSPMRIKGRTRVGYFHVECEACGMAVHFTDLSWVGGGVQVRATCDRCMRSNDFKLHVPTWADVVPGLESA